MKKTFILNVPNKTPERQLDSIRSEIKKYLARERRKPIPENVDFWDFDCKIGETAQNASVIKEVEIKAMINQIAAEKKESFYLEITAKPGHKAARKR